VDFEISKRDFMNPVCACQSNNPVPVARWDAALWPVQGGDSVLQTETSRHCGRSAELPEDFAVCHATDAND
jgi:hypothetical protein